MDNIAAVAARIQERASQLTSERATLTTTLTELASEKATLEVAQNENNAIRRELLAIIRSRHGVELELLRLRHDKNVNSKKTGDVKIEVKETNRKTFDLRKEWEKVSMDLYAKHEVEVELSQRRAEGAKRRRENKRRERQVKLHSLYAKAERAAMEAKTMHMKREKVREEIRRMDGQEEQEDEEIASLALQIKATLAKKTSLRAALKDSQDQHLSANEVMIRWEKECMELAR
mmetsp:Transcript_53317/g.79228  ORF Transcript_53317/g.79228 Transcript_53317/m.79228 type:complete len:232 (-) Transcript_53317:271-966(-)|eukprot:CAMPEP_0195530806 /NCGR_PEP_ID=MMETSP0794_2-20130614/33866_1 /TAXON_ID=515487 /ORGANISM="Stephanopyxis turris, Strain CCMP 815" /LENGTH=231 /DNA_ID=CAMNT_0040662391 /DNA_START=60 /DNA_END=755 /DNA_ORIENTATION=+